MSEGYIKFNCSWQKEEFQLPDEIFTHLESARSELHALGLIGKYTNGIGFGNISARYNKQGPFIISGSATGGLATLQKLDYALVTNFDISKNLISCTGMTQASSESMTHAAVYQSLPDVGAVIHIHCLWLWEKLLKTYPATPQEIEYGTPEMAGAIGMLALKIKDQKEKIIVMGGHREGILAFGSNLAEICAQIINIYNRYNYE